MTREEFEAVLALEGKYKLLVEPSVYRWGYNSKTEDPNHAGWMFAGLKEINTIASVYGDHAATEEEVVNRMIEFWEGLK
jgi:hypothetical protein